MRYLEWLKDKNRPEAYKIRRYYDSSIYKISDIRETVENIDLLLEYLDNYKVTGIEEQLLSLESYRGYLNKLINGEANNAKLYDIDDIQIVVIAKKSLPFYKSYGISKKLLKPLKLGDVRAPFKVVRYPYKEFNIEFLRVLEPTVIEELETIDSVIKREGLSLREDKIKEEDLDSIVEVILEYHNPLFYTKESIKNSIIWYSRYFEY